jgi:hypothetical protein
MRRLVLPAAMVLSLWPIAFVAVLVVTHRTTSSKGDPALTVPAYITNPATQFAAPEQLRFGGKSYSCPLGTGQKLAPIKTALDERQRKLKTEQDKANPDVQTLTHLVERYDRAAGQYTHILHSDCD